MRDRDRDAVVGDALRQLDDVPEHRPGFWTELHERLVLETPAPVPVRGRRPGASRWLAVAAAVVVLAGGALVALRAGSDSDAGRTPPATGPGPAPTITMVSSVQGVVVVETAGQPAERWTFALDDRGRFAAHRDDGTSVIEDPAAGIAVNTVADGTVYRKSGTPLGLLGLLRRDIGWSVAALAADGDARVVTGEQDGRPVWIFDGDVEPNKLAGEGGVDHVYAAVDRASQLPLVVRSLSRGRVVAEQHIEDLRIGAAIPSGTFEVAPGEHAIADDQGWRRVDPASADVPDLDVPAGYSLADVAVHDAPLVTGPEGGNPGTGPVLSMAYRRGVDVLVVTIQPSGTGNVWDDPLGQEGLAVRARPFDTGGIVRGGIVVDPRVVPHAWADRAGQVVTVSGAGTASELAAVALSVPDVTLVVP
jgi:hypothetical protein